MASIKKLDERRYKITVSNGYRPNGKKICKAERAAEYEAAVAALFRDLDIKEGRGYGGEH